MINDIVMTDLNVFLENTFNNTNKTITLFCDMDGVLSDFDAHLKNILPDMERQYRAKQISISQFWKELNDYGLDRFWSSMPWMKDGKLLWRSIYKYNPIILTKVPVTGKHKAIIGKKYWIKREISSDAADNAIMISDSKSKFASPLSILIDDHEKNINQFISAGGTGILHTNTQNTLKELNNVLIKR